jgi:hypothetical protein
VDPQLNSKERICPLPQKRRSKMILIEQETGSKCFVDTVAFAIGNNEEPFFSYSEDSELAITSSSSYCPDIIGECIHEDVNNIQGFMSYYKDNSVNFWGIASNNNFDMLLNAIQRFSYEEEDMKLISSFWKKLDKPKFKHYEYMSVFIGCGSHCFENDEWEEREKSGLTAAQIIFKRKEEEGLTNGEEYLLHSSKPLK